MDIRLGSGGEIMIVRTRTSRLDVRLAGVPREGMEVYIIVSLPAAQCCVMPYPPLDDTASASVSMKL